MRVSLRAAAAVLVAAVALPFSSSSAADRFDEVVQFGTGPGAERVLDMVRDGAGNTYVVGSTFGAFPGFTNEHEADGFVAKLDPAGTVLWADQFGGQDDGDNALHAVALDGAGAVYVAGITQQPLHAPVRGYSDPVIRKYDADGRLLWGSQPSGTGSLEGATGIAVAGDTVHVTGGSYDGGAFLRRYSSTGALLGSTEEPATMLWDAAAEGGDVYVVGNRWDPGGEVGPGEGFVRRITAGGATEVPFAGTGEPMRVALSATAVVTSGTSWDEAPATVVTRWDRSLAERWTWRGEPLPHEGLAITAAGEVFLGGLADWDSGDAVLRKLRADGTEAWGARIDGAGWPIGAVLPAGDRIAFAGASTRELTPGGVGAYVASWPTVRVVPVTRLAGADRIATAIAVSRAAHPLGADTAVLVTARSAADAVVAGPVAASAGGPVLLVGDQLPDVVRVELARLLEPGATVTIVGGTRAVPTAVEAALHAEGYEVERLAGVDRFETAVEVARAVGAPAAVIADGRGWPDALVAGPAAARTGRAVVLTDGRTLPDVTRGYLREAPAGHLAIGGPAAHAAPGAEAIVGADRYETAGLVADQLFGPGRVVGVATGADFPDALTLVPLLVRDSAPLLLTPPDRLAAVVEAKVGLHLLEVYLAGGTSALHPAVEQQLRPLLTEG